MVWQWGQFLDHDLSLTETADPTESMGILIPQGDYHFDRSGVGNLYINFSRSEFRHGLAADVPREQVDQTTQLQLRYVRSQAVNCETAREISCQSAPTVSLKLATFEPMNKPA
jgi:hypothetical protein